MGGEKTAAVMAAVAFAGSPPRGRGKVYAVAPVIFVNGIPPAWAGKSPEADPGGHPTQDHPRVGGEKQKRSKPC